ncbi:hypothetical protein [Cellulomonas sp. P5_C6]
MRQAQLIGGLWALPTLEKVGDGAVELHVSVAVDEVDGLAGTPVAVDVQAGGRSLEVTSAPADGDYYYLETLAVTAVADFAYANPEGLTPETVTVTIGGESASWPTEDAWAEPDPGGIPMV